MCVICMKYRILILIVIIISLGRIILLSYIANTSRTHACTPTNTHTHTHTRAHAHIQPRTSPFRLSLFDGSVAPSHHRVNAPFRRFRGRSMAGRCFIQINSRAGGGLGIRDSFGCFSRIKECLGRTETRARERKCFQLIRTI